MTAILVTPPAIEPLTLAEVKAHLRLTTSDDDTLLAALITTARLQVEQATRRVLIEQAWRICLDDWPKGGVFTLPITPVVQVTAITVYNASGVPTTLPTIAYEVDSAGTPPRVAIKAAAGIRQRRRLNGIEIDLVAGYGPSGLAVPHPLRQAILVLVARWYENRDGAAYGIVPAALADTFESLIAPYRSVRLS